MIRLIIDGTEVCMDQSAFSIVRENPLLTKAGDYTLDIDLDLRSEINAKLYNKVSRFHSTSISMDKPAELWDGNKLLMRGTAILLKLDGSVAKVQLVSDNSELNYIYDDTTLIRNMDWGVVQTRNRTSAAIVNRGWYGEVIDGIRVTESYPQLFKDDFTDFGGNAGIYNQTTGSNGKGYAVDTTIAEDTFILPQPYLLYYIDKLPEVLGYTMGQCDIDRDKYKKLIIVHGYDSNEYAKYLPDWTLTEFISEIEKFFNVVFYVNNHTKVLDILAVDKFYESVDTVFVNKGKIVDEREVDYGEEASTIQTSYENVGYKLPNSEFWRFASMDEKVYALSEKINLDWTHWRDGYDPAKYQVFYDEEADVEWVHYEDSNGENRYGRFVNQFAPVVKNSRVSRTELKIIPAKILASYRVGDHGSYTFIAPIPVHYENNWGRMSNAVRNGVESSAGDVMQVAFYLGFCRYDPSISFGTTMCCTARYHELFNDKIRTERYGADRWLNLSLNSKCGRCVNELVNKVSLDTTVLFHIEFIFSGWLDPRSRFVINNRAFFCKQLGYEFDKNELKRIVKGDFYPALEISASQQEEPSDPIDEPVTSSAEETYASISASELGGFIQMYNTLGGRFFVKMNGLYGSFSKQDCASAIGTPDSFGYTADYVRIAGGFADFNDVSRLRVIKYRNGSMVYDNTEWYVNGWGINNGSFFVDLDKGANFYLNEMNVGDVYDYIFVCQDGYFNYYKTHVRFIINA